MSNCILRHIPNTLTCLNLFSGCMAATAAFEGSYLPAFGFICLSAVFDFFDGLAARALNAHSPIGKDLDSLADDISFGLAPATLVFHLMGEMTPPQWLAPVDSLLPYLAFLIAVFSALRLAKFNNDTRQATSFIGLPVPANALFWASLVLMAKDAMDEEIWSSLEPAAYLQLILLLFIFSWLLVSEIPMFSLKKIKEDRVATYFFLGCIPLFGLFHMKAFVPIIVWYILLSLIKGHKK